MADTVVTVYAAEPFFTGMRDDPGLVYKFIVAMDAVGVKQFAAGWPHLDRLVKILQRKRLGMQKAVLTFFIILAEKIMGQVAIVTGSGGMMTGLLPAIVLVAHDVTIDACFGVVAQIRCALGIIKGIASQPRKHPRQRGKSYQCNIRFVSNCH